jgi:hypothetical protein
MANDDTQSFVFDGVSWTGSPIADEFHPVEVSCVSSTWCTAVGYYGIASIFDGSGWSTPVKFDRHERVQGVSCASDHSCVAIDEYGYATKYNGVKWFKPDRISSLHGHRPELRAVSCSSMQFCAVVDEDRHAVMKIDGTWQEPEEIPARTALYDVSCASDSFCMAVDSAGRGIPYRR